jgi:hypothetical protein
MAIALNYKDSIWMARAHGYAGTREAAMAAFARSWRREQAMPKATNDKNEKG